MLRVLILSAIIESSSAGKVWVTPAALSSKLPPTLRFPDKQMVRMYRHRVYGLQETTKINSTVGTLVNADCIFWNCARNESAKRSWAPLTTIPPYRRNLAHLSGGKVAVPSGWWPDYNMPATDLCDMNTVFDATRLKKTSAIAVVTMVWYAQCVVKVRSGKYMTSFQDVGFKGVLVATGSGSGPMSIYANWVGEMYDSNPCPQIPVLIVLVSTPFYANCNGTGPSSQPGIGVFQGGLGPTMVAVKAAPAIAHVELSDDPMPPISDALNSAGSIFFAYVYGIISVLLIPASFYALRKNGSKKLLTYNSFVLLFEGVVVSFIRAYFIFAQFPMFYKAWSVDWSNWLYFGAQEIFSNSSTWVAAMLWMRIVLNLSSGGALKMFHIATVSGTVIILFFSFYVSIWFPFSLSLNPAPAYPLSFKKYTGVCQTTDMRTDVMVTISTIQIIMVLLFAAASVLAASKLFRAAAVSATLAKSLRRMLPWVILQIFGSVLTTALNWWDAAGVQQTWDTQDVGLMVFSWHFRTLSPVLVSLGQVGFVFAISSSSSSK